MIKSLALTNFRSHKDTELEFSPHINVIVGQSDSGKSNIVRALNWIISNRPLGENVVQRGKEQALAQVILEKDKEQVGVTRVKGKGVNRYILSVAEEDVNFSSFGTSLPEPVLEVLNLSDINVQKQNEQYFLVFDSPGQVATYIRSITKLDDVDQIVKLLTSKIHEKKRGIANCQDNLKEVEVRLEELSRIDLKGLEERIKKTHSFIEANEKLQRKQQELLKLFKELERIEKSTIVLPENVDQVLENYSIISKSYQKVYNTRSSLTVLVNELGEVEQQKLILPETSEVFSDVNAAIQKYNNIGSTTNDLHSLIEKLERVVKLVASAEYHILILEEEEVQLMNQLDICPFCNTKLSEDARNHLLNCA